MCSQHVLSFQTVSPTRISEHLSPPSPLDILSYNDRWESFIRKTREIHASISIIDDDDEFDDTVPVY